MQVPLTADQEALLCQLATTTGRAPDQLAQEVLGSYLEQEARFRAAVLLGREQMERGEGISHEDVVAHFEKRYGA
jgi:predicted transcriptional regulator